MLENVHNYLSNERGAYFQISRVGFEAVCGFSVSASHFVSTE
jgi:hypothetical protein